MKKYLIIIALFVVGTITISASTSNFKFSTNGILKENVLENSIMANFDDTYALKSELGSSQIENEKELIELTKKTTSLLLGNINSDEETNEEYYKRHKEYLENATYNHFPKSEDYESGYDESIDNYNYAILSEFAVPSLFLAFDKYDIKYNSYGEINLFSSKNLIISTITLPSITMNEENKYNPLNYDRVNSSIKITYFFIELNGKYTLAHLFGETSDEIENYLNELSETEDSNVLQSTTYGSENFNDIYDFSKLKAVSETEINNIYTSNKANIFSLNTLSSEYIVESANGFLIGNGLIVTTWKYIDASLTNGQTIIINDGLGNSYKMEGIVTANPETDTAVIKLSTETESQVNISLDEVNVEDPVFMLTSKTDIGLTIQSGIVISTDGYLKNSIPSSSKDQGGPIFNENGEVIGMNTIAELNSNTSLSITSNILYEIQEMFKNIPREEIKAIDFQTLKEEYYLKSNAEEGKNYISESVWEKFGAVGNLKDSILLDINYANNVDNIISVRYKNNIGSLISSMDLTKTFTNNLKNSGFEEVLYSESKSIYKNNEYEIIIMSEFDYLIIVMVEL